MNQANQPQRKDYSVLVGILLFAGILIVPLGSIAFLTRNQNQDANTSPGGPATNGNIAASINNATLNLRQAEDAYKQGNVSEAVSILQLEVHTRAEYNNQHNVRWLVQKYETLRGKADLTYNQRQDMQETLNHISGLAPDLPQGYDQQGNVTGLVPDYAAKLARMPVDPQDTAWADLDAKAKKALAQYKHDGVSKLIAQGRELYRSGQYKAAVDMMTQAKEYGSHDAARMLPAYQSRLKTALIAEEKKQANMYSGDGDVKIAIDNVELRRSTESHEAGKNATFIYVLVDAKNFGQDIRHVNPNDFTLATPDGETTPHNTDTYSLSNYFNAVDLRPGQSTSGWIVFYLMRAPKYTLSYQGFGGTAQKPVIP